MQEDIKQPEKLISEAQQPEIIKGDTKETPGTVHQLEKASSQLQPQKSEIETNQSGQKKNEQPPTENLSKELINHLSKEIETITNNNNMFRAKTSFIVFVGPFILLGSFLVALRNDQRRPNISFELGDTWTITLTIIGIALILAGYFGVGYMSSRIEKHGWETCNDYRKIIERLYKDSQSTIEEIKLTRDYELMKAYLWTYSCMAAAFIGVLLAVLPKIL